MHKCKCKCIIFEIKSFYVTKPIEIEKLNEYTHLHFLSNTQATLNSLDSASSLTAVPATAVGQARASPHGQHCGCLVHQPVGRYTITPHVKARPPSPPLESHAVQVTARSPHPVEA